MDFNKNVKDAKPKERLIAVALGILVGSFIGICVNYFVFPSTCHGKTLDCVILQVNPPILPEGEHGTIILDCEPKAFDVLKDNMKIKIKPAKKKAIEGC